MSKLEQYQKIVVSGFLYHQGKVLVIQRSLAETFLPGFFELPGGKVDFGEDPSSTFLDMATRLPEPLHSISRLEDDKYFFYDGD